MQGFTLHKTRVVNRFFSPTAQRGQSVSVPYMSRALLFAWQTSLLVDKSRGIHIPRQVACTSSSSPWRRRRRAAGARFAGRVLPSCGVEVWDFCISPFFFFVYLDGTACYSLWVLLLREHCGFNAHSQVTFLSPLSALLSAFQVHRKRFPANAACPVISEPLIA